MRNIISTKKVLFALAGGLFALAMFFNTTLNFNNNGESLVSLQGLETAKAQTENICEVLITECYTIPGGCYREYATGFTWCAPTNEYCNSYTTSC